MSIPTLFLGNEKEFTTNGIGRLSDATRLEIKEDLNGEYELEMDYPITGIYYDQIAQNRILNVVVNRKGEKQPFEIYEISQPIGGIVTVYAQHISYRLKFITVEPFKATGTPVEVWSELVKHCVTTLPFKFKSDSLAYSTIEFDKPQTIKEILQGTEGSFLDIFGGEFEWDNYTIKFHKKRGIERSYNIYYGSNLTDLTQDVNNQDDYNAIFPYIYKQANDDSQITMLPERYLTNDKFKGVYPYIRVKPVDLSDKFKNATEVSVEMLRQAGQEYIEANNIGEPNVSIDVSFVNFADTTEYGFDSKKDVSMGDTVKVVYKKLGVDALAEVTGTVWDGLLNRYKSIHLGVAKKSLVNQIHNDNYEQEQNFNNANDHQDQKFDTYIAEIQQGMKLEGQAREQAINELQEKIAQESEATGRTIEDLKSETEQNFNSVQEIFTEELSHKVGQDMFDKAKENTDHMIEEINQNLEETQKELRENFAKQVENINQDIQDIRTVMASDTSGAIQLIKDKDNPNKIDRLIANNTDGSSLLLNGNGLEFRDRWGNTTSAVTRDGHIAADRLTGTIVNAISTNSAYINGGTIQGTYITGNTISGGYINGSNITGGNISSANLSSSTISGSTIVAGQVYGALKVYDSGGGSMNISIGGNDGSWSLSPGNGGDVIHVGSNNYESMMSSGQIAVKSSGGETHVYGTSININGYTALHAGNWQNYVNFPTYSEIKGWVKEWVADYVTETATNGHRLIIWKG